MGSEDEGMDETVRRVPLLTSTESGGREHPMLRLPTTLDEAREQIAKHIDPPDWIVTWGPCLCDPCTRARAIVRGDASASSRGGASQVQRQAPAVLVGERREPAVEQNENPKADEESK